MDVKLKEFLTNIKLKDDEISLFDNAILTSATYVTSSKKFILNISFNSLCNPEVFFVIDKIRNIKEYDFNINIIQHDTLINSAYVTNIFQEVILKKYFIENDYVVINDSTYTVSYDKNNIPYRKCKI